MSRRSWLLLLFLGSLWGASYLFIKVGLEDGLSPAMIVFSRTALAALVLVPLAMSRGALSPLRGRLGTVFLMAAIQVAAPFMLISFGEERIASSLTGILIASAPLFTALLAVAVDQDERSHGWSLVGVGAGIVGVALLLGLDVSGSSGALIGAGMVLLAALGYAIGAFMLKRSFSDVDAVGLSASTMTASALLVAPFALLSAPTSVPSLEATASIIVLGVLGTGLAFVIFFSLIASEGPANASLVSYIAPPFAVLYGVTVLGESVGAGAVLGLVLILGGSWLAAGGWLPPALSRRLRPGRSIPVRVPPPSQTTTERLTT